MSSSETTSADRTAPREALRPQLIADPPGDPLGCAMSTAEHDKHLAHDFASWPARGQPATGTPLSLHGLRGRGIQGRVARIR